MSSTEIGSISLDDFLNQYLYYLRDRVNSLEAQKSELELKSAVFNDLSSKLEDLEDIAERLAQTGASSVFRSKTVTSSDETILTATASGSAAVGSHTIFVTQLARAHSVVSNRYNQDDTTISDANSGTKTFSITVNGETYNISVTINAGDSNETVLSRIATEINDATDGEVVASCVLDTPTTCKLSITSGSTGTAGKMTFTDTDGLLATLGVTNSSQATDTVGGYVYADLGNNELDAKLTVDGINVISSSNVVENVIQGVTLTLLAEQEDGDSAVTITTSIDVEGIRSEIEDFLEAYNDAFEYLVSKTSVDGTTYERGILSGDYPYITLRTSLRQTMNTFISSSSTYSALSQIGISSSRSGTFSISDSDALEEAITEHPEALEELFAGTDGIATTLVSLLDGYTSPGGTISSSKKAVNSKIDLIEDSIDRQEEYIRVRENALREQFSALQEALYALQMSQAIANSYSSLLGI